MAHTIGTPAGAMLNYAYDHDAPAAAFERGMAAEVAVGEALNGLPHVTVAHNVLLPSRARVFGISQPVNENADHVVISGRRVLIIDTKCATPGTHRVHPARNAAADAALAARWDDLSMAERAEAVRGWVYTRDGFDEHETPGGYVRTLTRGTVMAARELLWDADRRGLAPEMLAPRTLLYGPHITVEGSTTRAHFARPSAMTLAWVRPLVAVAADAADVRAQAAKALGALEPADPALTRWMKDTFEAGEADRKAGNGRRRA